MVGLKLLGEFLKEFVCSIGIGAIMGLLGTFLFKSLRFLHNSCVLETGIILYIGYISFTICDIFKLSGVISVLVTGIVLAHYNTYNLS
jgi:NhaP-type Na+/H+ or K+/H+ antiporter